MTKSQVNSLKAPTAKGKAPNQLKAIPRKPSNTKPAVVPAVSSKATPTYEILAKVGELPPQSYARVMTGPTLINANITKIFGKGTFGEEVELKYFVDALSDCSDRIKVNNMQDVEATLISQSISLNIMFGELSRRAALNMNDYLDTSERYLRMALKAQNQCRMTLETLSNIKNPPVVYAKQANIANGPQQVNNGSVPRAHAEENQSQPNKLLEQSNEQRMDNGKKSETKAGNPQLEAVGAFYGT